MYKTFTAKDYRKYFNLPDSYMVDGLISIGGGDEEKHFNRILDILDEFNIVFSSIKLTGFLSHILEVRTKNKNYWFCVVYGGAMLSEYVHLACLFGSKKNIHLGSCGGLYPEIKSLDVLIPTFSYGDESTTRCYDKNAEDGKHYPDSNLSKNLEDRLFNKYVVRKGPIITHQAMMGETFEDIKEWSERGYFGVEMETSTVFSVSKYFNVPSAALLYVSDNLIKGQTVGDESHTQEKEKRERVRRDMYETGISILLN